MVQDLVLAVPERPRRAVEDATSRDSSADLEEAWRICSDLFCSAIAAPAVATTDGFRRELLFCLLSGFSISYEHALSATEVLLPLNPLSASWSSRDLYDALFSELAKPQFKPTRQDGSDRRYRFPQRKAQQIVAARQWLVDRNDVVEELAGIDDEASRRRLLCSCPGVGPKTASWLLRNLGLATDLAILDVHLIRALRESGRISAVRLPRDYEIAERAFLQWCRELDAPAAAFDLFVWEWQRGSLVPQ